MEIDVVIDPRSVVVCIETAGLQPRTLEMLAI